MGRRIAREFLVGPDVTRDGGPGLVTGMVEAALAEVWARWERVLEGLGGAVPAGQLRALLVIDDCGVLPVAGLAEALGISGSAASRLCDRLEAAGLVAWDLAGNGDQALMLAVTQAGQRLAGWVREQRRSDLAHALESMSAEGRQALVRGLTELTAALR